MGYGKYPIHRGGPFSFIEKGIKGLARAVVPGFSAGEALVRGITRKPTASSQMQPTLPTGGVPIPPGLTGIGKHIAKIPGWGWLNQNPLQALTQTQGRGPVAMDAQGHCPKGYHPNKQDGKYGQAGTYCVRNRSMNPANGRAIGRAATRIKRGAKQYSRVLRILGKKTGKMVPRGRRK